MAEVENDMCIICHEPVRIPIKTPQNCGCRQTLCYYCFTVYNDVDTRLCNLQLDKCKCLMCNTPLKLVSHDKLIMGLPDSYICELDKKYGDITCQHCKKWKGSRIDFTNKHATTCKKLLVKCDLCKQSGRPIEHSFRCADCGEHMLKCERKSHDENCIAHQCPTCGVHLSKHETKNCEFCDARIILCPDSTMDAHYYECTMVYFTGGKKYNIDNPASFSYRCLKCECWIPNSVNRETHSRICITLRSLKLSL